MHVRRHDRPRRSHLRIAGATTVLITAAVTLPTVASAAPNTAHRATDPVRAAATVALATQNEQIVEKYNQADNKYHAKQGRGAKATASYRRAQHRLTAAENQLAQSAAAQYEGGTFSATGALLSSDSGSSYLDQLQTLSMLSQHNSQVVTSFTAIQKQAKDAKITADNLYAAGAADPRGARPPARPDPAADRQVQEAAVLAQRPAARDAGRRAGRTDLPQAPRAAMTSDRGAGAVRAAARAAVQFALDQIGKPYVFGAAGRSAYDCSGLTMAAWQQGGVSLPHSAANQYNYGRHVSLDKLRPGDLIFFYQPIGHVTIYIGNGMMVSAPSRASTSRSSRQSFSNDFVGATRLVG